MSTFFTGLSQFLQHYFTAIQLFSFTMGHDHTHGTKNLAAAFWINLVFSLIEIAGGLWTNSMSILSDALHDLGDSISLGLAWYLQGVSVKGRDAKYTYGYKRYSLLGALVNAVILLSGSILIAAAAVPRLIDPPEVHSLGMMWMAVLGIFFNGLAYYRLHHGHSHNEKVVSLHLLEDVLGWVAVLIGSLVIHLTGLYIIDPILSICIAAFIAYNVFRHIRSSWRVFLQGIPRHIEITGVKDALATHPGIISFHDLHVWSLDGEKGILTAHLVVDPAITVAERRKIKDDIHQSMAQLGIVHCTIEMESPGEECILAHH